MKMLTAALVLSASTLVAQTTANPFFAESTLPFHAPPFDKIHDADYQPAIEEGMKQHLAEIEAIENDPAPPTFANTIEAMEKSGRLLGRVQRVFGGMSQANTNPTIQKIQSEEAQPLAAHRDAIYLNPKLFARVKAVYEKRASLNPEQKHLAERTYKDFVRSGALLSDAEKEKLRALNKEQSKLTTDFRKKVLADTNASALALAHRPASPRGCPPTRARPPSSSTTSRSSTACRRPTSTPLRKPRRAATSPASGCSRCRTRRSSPRRRTSKIAPCASGSSAPRRSAATTAARTTRPRS